MKKRISILAMFLVLTFLSVSVFADEQGLIEDSGESINFELSPVNEEFYDSDTSGIKASPLEIQSEVVGNFSHYSVNSNPIPSKYDLRATGRVTPVKNQEVDGPCWAFATYAAMESYLKPYGEFDFSEKHLRNTHGFDWSTKEGGNRSISAAYFARWGGPVSEKDDPYDPVITVSPENLERLFDIDKVIFLPDINYIEDTYDIKKAIMDYGAVYSVMNSSSYFENKDNYSYYNPGGGRPNHAVAIVGWDDTFPASSFSSRAPGNGAWIVKNSWGQRYMDGGYFYVSYYDKFLGKSNAVFIPKNKDERGRIYQHDPLGPTRSVGYAGQGYMANIFTAKADETLHEVGLFTVANLTEYEIYIVNDVQKTSQLSQNRVKIAEGRIDYPGYYTVDVTPTKLTKGENFAVEIRMDTTSTGYRYPLPVETKVAGFSSKASAKKGQTYVSQNGVNWSDLTKDIPDANGCIKAITTTGDVPDNNIIIDTNPINPTIKPTNMYFKEGNEGFIYLTEKTVLHPVFEPADAEISGIKWTSLDNSIIKTDQDGTIYPRKVGKTSVVAQTEDNLINCRMLVQVVPEGFRVEGVPKLIATGKNDYKEPEKPDKPDEPALPPFDPNNPIDPGNIGPIYDDKVPRDISLSIPNLIMMEGETEDIASRVKIYPNQAEYTLSYRLSEKGIVSIDENGVVTALKPGNVNIDIMTDNGLKTTLNVSVRMNSDLHEICMDSWEVSNRKAGIFTIRLNATQGEKGYTGPAQIVLKSGDKEVSRTVYFKGGKAESKYNGGQFANKRKNFDCNIRIKNFEKSFSFSFVDNEPVLYDESFDSQKVFPVEIKSLEVSDRTGGIFTVNIEAYQGDRGYNGLAEISVTGDGKNLIREFEIENGFGSYTFNGAQFGVWRKEFSGVVTIENATKTFEVVFP